MPQDGFANFMNVGAGGKIHTCRAVSTQCAAFSILFNLEVTAELPCWRLNLAQRRHADGHGLQFGDD